MLNTGIPRRETEEVDPHPQFISRTLGVLLSLATVVPLGLMTRKYLATRNVYFNVNGTSRTTWPTDTETVYNYVYLTFSVVSLLPNIVIVLAYSLPGLRGSIWVDV